MEMADYSAERLEPGLRFPLGINGNWWRVLEVNVQERTVLVIADRECHYRINNVSGKYRTVFLKKYIREKMR